MHGLHSHPLLAPGYAISLPPSHSLPHSHSLRPLAPSRPRFLARSCRECTVSFMRAHCLHGCACAVTPPPTASPTTKGQGPAVDCEFTIDNVVTNVTYNGKALTPSGDVNDWRAVKRIAFFEVPGAQLALYGYDEKAGNTGHCADAGFLMKCTAASGPFKDMTSGSSGWLAAGSTTDDPAGQYGAFDVPCTSASGFNMNGYTTGKIWAAGGQRGAIFRYCPYILAARAQATCPSGTAAVNRSECLAARQAIAAQGEFIYPGKRGLVVGSWEGVPVGCSVQYADEPGQSPGHVSSSETQDPHWNDAGSSDNSRLTNGGFRLMCRSSP